ncbi:hypothetical protein BKA81DRAFT_12759 [Phyllosticta paracitricarpa]
MLHRILTLSLLFSSPSFCNCSTSHPPASLSFCIGALSFPCLFRLSNNFLLASCSSWVNERILIQLSTFSDFSIPVSVHGSTARHHHFHTTIFFISRESPPL